MRNGFDTVNNQANEIVLLKEFYNQYKHTAQAYIDYAKSKSYTDNQLVDAAKYKNQFFGAGIFLILFGILLITFYIGIVPIILGRLEKAMAKEKLKPRFTPDKSNVLVTDEHNAYNRVTYGTGAKHEVVKADKHARGKYNLAKVNAVHNALSLNDKGL